MILNPSPILHLPQPCDEVIPILFEQLGRAGFQVLRTFDLIETRAQPALCTCQQHATQNCDCQLVVLLVYGIGNQPVTLMVQGREEKTWVSIIEHFRESNTMEEQRIRKVLLLSDGQ